MSRVLALAFAATFLAPSSSHSAVIFVPGDFSVISNAVLAAASGDTIRVAGNGGSTYVVGSSIVIDKPLTIEGGWRRDFQVRDHRIYVSVIRDNFAERPVFRVQNTSSVTIDGFTILGGRIGIEATNAECTVRNCGIRGQRNGRPSVEARAGGAFRIIGGSMVVENTRMRDVISSFGGAGIGVLGGGNLTLLDSRLEDLLSADPGGLDASGGAITANGSGVLRLERCTIQRSGTADDGGLIWSRNSSLEAIDCLFKNGSGLNGGAIVIADAPSANMVRCTVEECLAVSSGGGIHIKNCGKFTMSECRIAANASKDEGGGLWMENTPFSFTDCRWESNFFNQFPFSIAVRGGGVRSISSSGTVVRCCFVRENAKSWGGSWSQVGGEIEFSDCTMDGCISQIFGGGHSIELAGRAKFTRSLIRGCRAKFGGGLSAAFTGRLEVDRCTLTENEGASAGAAIYLDTGGTASVSSSILCCAPRGGQVYCMGGAIQVTHTNAWNDPAINSRQEYGGGCSNPVGTSGNLEVNPLFCPPPGPPPFCDPTPAFSLQPGSPCLGAGAGGVDMGWRGTGCTNSGPLNLEAESWGRLKARYRTP
jgi:hypothetical protein